MCPKTSEQFEEIRGERRASIEAAALEVFAEDGYHLASVSKIARQAGISKGLMYNYFESKEALLKSLIRDVIAEATAKLHVPIDRSLQKEDVITFVYDSFDIVLENPQKWKLFTSVFMQQDVMAIMKEEMMQMAAPYMEPFIHYFAQNGFEEDPMSAMLLFHSAIDGVQIKLMIDPKAFPIEGIRKMIIKLFIK